MHIKHMQTSVQGHIMVRAEQLVQRAASHVRSLPEFREVKKKQKKHRNLKQHCHLWHLLEELDRCPTFTSADV